METKVAEQVIELDEVDGVLSFTSSDQ